jgi:hypothetical protein
LRRLATAAAFLRSKIHLGLGGPARLARAMRLSQFAASARRALLAELVDATDLKSVVLKRTCRFESGRGHQSALLLVLGGDDAAFGQASTVGRKQRREFLRIDVRNDAILGKVHLRLRGLAG